MSGYIQKSRVPLKRKANLPHVAYVACLEAENEIKKSGANAGKEFKNEQGRIPLEGPPLPKVGQECVYRKFRAGKAHERDPLPVGQFRLVFEITKSSGEVRESYFTQNEYEKGTFFRIV